MVFMDKCVVCGGRKAFRDCPGAGGKICSACCGTKRLKDIKCPDSCDILKTSLDLHLLRDVQKKITDEIGRTFRTEADDVFKIPAAAKFAEELESAFLDNFFDDERYDDDDIRTALVSIYSRRSGREMAQQGGGANALVMAIWRRADKNNPDLSDGLKTKTLLRILKSIRDSSGGNRGARGYLDMLQDQFSGSGPFDSDEDDESDGNVENGLDAAYEQEPNGGIKDAAAEPMEGLQATTTGQLMGELIRMAMAGDPDGVGAARRMYRKEFSWIAEHIGTDWSDPVMDNEFITWFCTENKDISGETPVEAFARDWWLKLDERTRLLTNAIRRSVRSVFQVAEKEGNDYRLVDCRTEQRYVVRTVDLTAPIDVGATVFARIIWNTDPVDGCFHFQGLVLAMEEAAVEDARNKARILRETAVRFRNAFIERFGRMDPTFTDGEEGYEALSKYREALVEKGGSGKRRKSKTWFPSPGELWDTAVGPWERLIEEKGPVALMFEGDGLHASPVYPGLARALDGTEKDGKIASEALRKVIEEDEEIPLTSLRRLLLENIERSVRLASAVYPDIKDFEALKRLIEMRRAEPFDLEPTVDLRQCMPPVAPELFDDDIFEVKATPMGNDKHSKDMLYHIRTGKCPYSKRRCQPAGCKYGERGMDRCPVHSGEKS